MQTRPAITSDKLGTIPKEFITMASARTTFVELAKKVVSAKYPAGPKDTDMQESKKGTIFAPVFDIGGFMPENVGSITLGGKSYDISLKVQISVKRTGSSGAVKSGDIDIK